MAWCHPIMCMKYNDTAGMPTPYDPNEWPERAVLQCETGHTDTSYGTFREAIGNESQATGIQCVAHLSHTVTYSYKQTGAKPCRKAGDTKAKTNLC